MALVGEPPCNDSLLRFDCTIHLRSPVLARPTLVIQGTVDDTWKYVSTIGSCCSTDSIPVTASAEIAGKLVLSQGLASSIRPRKYYTIPREALEASLEDVEQLINFFVIEFQRVLYAENVGNTVAGFGAALMSYWLIKIVPFWGLSLIAVSCIYMGPLIYMTNKELIDHHVRNASEAANAQANQLKDLAGHHTARAQETVKSYAGDYSAKAQEYMGNVRGRSTSPELNSSKPKSNAPIKSEPGDRPQYNSGDFPHAPKQVKYPPCPFELSQCSDSHLPEEC